jgi:hypothetical protein
MYAVVAHIRICAADTQVRKLVVAHIRVHAASSHVHLGFRVSGFRGLGFQGFRVTGSQIL